MLQRIQTVYLILAVCALALCLFFPIARYAAPIQSTQQTVVAELNLFPKTAVAAGEDYSQGAATIVAPQKGFIKTWPLVVLLFACMAIAATSIMLYHNRVLQMRIVAVSLLLGAVYVFLIFIWAVDAYGKAFTTPYGADAPSVTYALGTWAPVAALLLLFLAQRAIRKDEEKVRAADRLR
ncbi:MAG: DUF4293 domain-containing protein [Bacteroidales bacterium]|nr:DUF4293 domain-containing protein [Bacteroidales bacterium]